MRNFLYAGGLVTSGLVSDGGEFRFGLAHYDDKNQFVFSDGSNIKKDEELYFVLCRKASDGGNVVLPFYNNKFRYNYSVYEAATAFSAKILAPDSIMPGVDYTILMVKKGVKFNERNRWHVTVHTKSSDTIDSIAASVVKQVNAISDNTGLRAEAVAISGKKYIVFTTIDSMKGFDYEILGADEFINAVVEYDSRGSFAKNDINTMRDLADKAAANVGYEYTYLGDANYLYPDYPVGRSIIDSEFADLHVTIYNIFFAEPRKVKTVDEVINQLIQVAFTRPNFEDFVKVLDALNK